MATLLDNLNAYRAEVLKASAKLLAALGQSYEFPPTHDPADIVLDTLDLVSQVEDATGN